MKENKAERVTVRLNDTQYKMIQKLIDDGTCKTPSAAMQHIINMAIIKGLLD